MTSPALGFGDLTLDQSAMSIQILPKPGLVTWHVFYKITLTLAFQTGNTITKVITLLQNSPTETTRPRDHHTWSEQGPVPTTHLLASLHN